MYLSPYMSSIVQILGVKKRTFSRTRLIEAMHRLLPLHLPAPDTQTNEWGNAASVLVAAGSTGDSGGRLVSLALIRLLEKRALINPTMMP